MQADYERHQRLRDLLATARDEGPTMLQIQQEQTRWARLRDEVATLKATGATGRHGLPVGRARAGAEIMPGIGIDQDGVARAHASAVRDLELQASEAEAVVKRMGARLHEAGQKRAILQTTFEAARRWAKEQQVLLPGESGIEMPSTITVQGPPPGTRDFFGRVA